MEVQLAPISANPDVLKLYHKQKSEFHFQQKSDNEFLVFLLDVAMKVITFVDQIRPNLIDACADDSLEAEESPDKKIVDGTRLMSPQVSLVDEDKPQQTPAKISKQSNFGGLQPFQTFNDNSNHQQRQSEILQRQHDIISRQVDTFPFPSLPENVIKPTFVKEGSSRRPKLKSSSQGSPASNCQTSDGQRTPDLDESNSSEKQEDSSMDITPTTPHSKNFEYRSRADSSASGGSRHNISIPTGAPLEFHNSMSPSKVHEPSTAAVIDPKNNRVLDINKIAATTIPSMAYMFSDKLATSAENTSDNVNQRRHTIGMQWATSEYKFDGSALHIMNGRNSRKPRTVFTWEQLKQMEETFKQKKYLCTEDRMILAQKLDLTDEQIKVWFQNRRQKWKKGGSKDDEVLEYSQYYDLFSRDGQGHEGGGGDRGEEQPSQRTTSISLPDHLRMKSEQMCMSDLQDSQSRIVIDQQEQTLKDELQRSIIDLKQSSQTNNEERHLIREQQIRAVAEESNARSSEPAHAMAE